MWIAHFIEDFNDTHSAVVWRLHHVIGDGISVAHMCFNMFNTAEDLQGMGATLHVPTAPRAVRLDESTSKVAQKVWCGDSSASRPLETASSSLLTVKCKGCHAVNDGAWYQLTLDALWSFTALCTLPLLEASGCVWEPSGAVANDVDSKCAFSTTRT
jgi:hypothetical protein